MIPGNIILTQKAEKDIDGINDWYDKQSEGLAEDFMDGFFSILKKVKKNSTAFRFIKRGVRRCKMKRFPYYIYYSPLDKIVILRIRHFKQQPLKRYT